MAIYVKTAGSQEMVLMNYSEKVKWTWVQQWEISQHSKLYLDDNEEVSGLET